MYRDHSPTNLQVDIEDYLEETLTTSDVDLLEPVRTRVLEQEQWYAQLLVLSSQSIPGTSTESVLPVAAAIELLHGYCRLRTEVIAQTLGSDQRGTWRLRSALLGGDYLHTVAYTVLGDLGAAQFKECYEILTTLSESIVNATHAIHDRSQSRGIGSPRFIDETAGQLGMGAAAMGVVVADPDYQHLDQWETLGRCVGAARTVLHTLDSEADSVDSLPLCLDEQALRRFGNCRLDRSKQALNVISSTADVADLRSFLQDTVTGEL